MSWQLRICGLGPACVFKRVKALLSCCWEFALSSFWLSEKKNVNNVGKLSPEIAYAWCQKPFLPFLPILPIISPKQCSETETVSQISESQNLNSKKWLGLVGMAVEWITKLQFFPGPASSRETSNIEPILPHCLFRWKGEYLPNKSGSIASCN